MNETNPSIKHEKLQGTTNMAQENNFRIKVQRQKQVHVRNNYCVLTLNRVLSIITHNILQCKMFWWKKQTCLHLEWSEREFICNKFSFSGELFLELVFTGNTNMHLFLFFIYKKSLCKHEYPATGFRSVLWCLFLEMFS